jgi:hypothetical protein
MDALRKSIEAEKATPSRAAAEKPKGPSKVRGSGKAPVKRRSPRKAAK